MKVVSDAYKASMLSSLRGKSFVKITFSNIDTTAAADSSYSDNGRMSFSDYDTMNYEYSYQRVPYAMLELNRWLLGGNSQLLPYSGIAKEGYVGSELSNAEGSYDTPPKITVDFSTPHVFPGMTLTFDTRAEEWFHKICVTYFKSDGSNAVTEVIVTDVTAVIEMSDENVTQVLIEFLEGLPYRRPRLERVSYGIEKQFYNDDIVSTKQKHDVDPLTRRLPKETFEFTILDFDRRYDPDNPSGVYKFIDVRSPISISFGYELDDKTIEWLSPDNYVLDGRPSVKNDRATFSGTGLVGGMSDIYYKDVVGEKTFYDMAVGVLRDAGLTPTSTGGEPWVVDESLKTMTSTAVLPIATHMECLQLIAHACRCKLYTDEKNIIHIEPFILGADKTDFVVDFSTIGEKTQTLSKIEQLKAISVAKYALVPNATSETLYEGTTDETTLHIEFGEAAQDVTVSVTGGTVVSQAIYGRAVDLELSSGTKTIKVTGKTLRESSMVVTYKVGNEGEVDKEENPLITNDAMCNALAAHVNAYLVLRNTYDLSYRGNPELEVGDVITMQTLYTDAMDGLVLTDEIDFNGSLSGKLKVKGIV